MKIEQVHKEQTTLLEGMKNKNVPQQQTGVVSLTEAFTVDIQKKGNGSSQDWGYGRPQSKEREKTAAEQFQREGAVDIATRMDQMVVLSHTVSPKDYEEMKKDGFSLDETTPEEMVTVVEKIKINMAKTGSDMVGPGDLDQETLEEALGSTALAKEVESKLEESDLPANQDNLKGVKEALTQLAGIEGMTEDVMGYLLQNDLEPTIENTYRATHSGNGSQVTSMEEAMGQHQELDELVEGFLESNQMEVSKEEIGNCKWLLANEIPLTVENLEKLHVLETIGASFGTDGMSFGDSMSLITKAIANGKRPQDANLRDLTQTRQREETRLKMTADANLTNEKKGLDTVDIDPISKEVESLKHKEEQYYKELLVNKLQAKGVSTQEIKDQLPVIEAQSKTMVGTMDALAQLRNAPEYVIGTPSFLEKESTLTQLLKQANARYETVGTAPRKDMGDSIEKAFHSVDARLEELEMETTGVNRRAVRILAYNRMEITKENIEKVKAADQKVQRTIEAMTGSVTLEMIRRGKNPLEMTLEETNTFAEEIETEQGRDIAKFSEFLWKLDQKNGITPEERESFIGIYRLIHQVEKTDGAAIGSVLQQGVELNMKNLLSAVRTGRRHGMDYTIDSTFSGVEGKSMGTAIDQQIETAYSYEKDSLWTVANHLTPEHTKILDKIDWQEMKPSELMATIEENHSGSEESRDIDCEYAKWELDGAQKVVKAGKEVYQFLERMDTVATPSNVMAAAELIAHSGTLMKQIFGVDDKAKSAKDQIEDLKDEVLEQFGESLKHPKELAKAQEALADVAENVMKTMINEKEQITAVDLRQLQLMCKEVKLAGQRAGKEESYLIPVDTPQGVETLALRVVRGKDTTGLVDILFHGELMGKIAASFQARENQISGLIATDSNDTRELLAQALPEFVGRFQEESGEPLDLSVAYMPDLSLDKASSNQLGQRVTESQEKNPVATKRLYHVAEAFIVTLQDLANL